MNKSQGTLINKQEMVHVLENCLALIDSRLTDHGARVAFIIYEMMKDQGVSPEAMKRLLLSATFHDIGAYKTEEIDKMVVFETEDVNPHSIYGYLFLREFSPLKSFSETILYHHTNFQDLSFKVTKWYREANLINLADRIDIYVGEEGGTDFKPIEEMAGTKYDPKYVEMFLTANEKYDIVGRLKNMEYRAVFDKEITKLPITQEEISAYINMMIYLVDFRSQYTVGHTINTVSLSLYLADKLGMGEEEEEELRLGALLHDIGKVAVPYEILEKPGKLTPEEMELMKNHVNMTAEIIKSIVNENVLNIATRHHEKLDGSGYPKGLKEEELTTSERIVAVSDILSALSDERSYKEGFSKEETIRLFGEMIDDGLLCTEVGKLAIDNYDEMIEIAEMNKTKLKMVFNKITTEFNKRNQE